MADLYWNAPSSPAYFNDANNWRVGSSSGPVSGSAPGSSDNVYFSPSSSTIGCIFNVDPTVNSFVADDPSGSLSMLSTTLQITVGYAFDISQAGAGQAAMFSQWKPLPGGSAVTVVVTGTGGTPYVNIGQYQIGKLVINRPSGTVSLKSGSGPFSIYPFKCYELHLQLGIAQFDVSLCNGAHLGYAPGGYASPALFLVSAAGYKKLDAQFPASKPIIMFGGFRAVPGTTSGGYYEMSWAADTVMEFRGPNALTDINIQPVPAYLGAPLVPLWVPYVYNYLGEDLSGSAVSSGGSLRYTNGPLKAYGVTSTAAGSSSGAFTRGVILDTGAPSGFFDLLISYARPGGSITPVLNIAGDATHQATLQSEPPGTQSKLMFQPASGPATVQTFYTTITDVNADISAGVQYIAYTADGNVDGGGNTNWLFTAAASGMLMFFF